MESSRPEIDQRCRPELLEPHRFFSVVVGQAVAQGGDHGPRCGVDGEPEDVGTVVVADRVELP
jgi:hypothetical protein